ncbi:MAG TPA: AI-2E family transporter [Acidimicrobiales bacterium]|jgi:predicted PurR-regulated permease PerM
MGDRIRQAGAVAWAVVGVVALLTVIGLVGWWLRVIFPPLVLAGAIVFLLNPIVTLLQRRGIPRVGGAAIAYLGIAGVLVGAGFLVSPLVADQADQLSEEWPQIRAKLERWVDDRAEQSEDWAVQLPTWDELQDQLDSTDQNLSDQLDRAREIGSRVFHVLLIAVLGPIIAFYLLVDLPHLRDIAESLVPERARPEVHVVAHRLNRAIGGFFRGQLMVALIVGAMVSTGLAVLDLPLWLIIGMVAGLFNIVPLIGPWIGAIPGVVVALTTRDVGTAVWVVAIMGVAQQVDNHFITPQVMQRAVKLHPVAVMLALLAGGTIAGIGGLLLAVPVAAVVKIVVGHLWRTYVLGEPVEALAGQWRAADEGDGGGVVTPVGTAPSTRGGVDPDEGEDDDDGGDGRAGGGRAPPADVPSGATAAGVAARPAADA